VSVGGGRENGKQAHVGPLGGTWGRKPGNTGPTRVARLVSVSELQITGRDKLGGKGGGKFRMLMERAGEGGETSQVNVSASGWSMIISWV